MLFGTPLFDQTVLATQSDENFNGQTHIIAIFYFVDVHLNYVVLLKIVIVTQFWKVSLQLGF